MFKKYSLFLCLVFAISFEPGFSRNPNNVAGLLSILKPDFYEASLINGAVYWELGYVMSLYDCGWERQPQGTIAVDGREEKRALINPEQAPALIRVVDKIFHRIPGSTGETDFGPTKSITQMHPNEVAKAVGTISALIKDIIRLADEAKKTAKELSEIGISTLKKMFKDCADVEAMSETTVAIISSISGKEKTEDLFDINEEMFSNFTKLKIPEQYRKLNILQVDCKMLLAFKIACDKLDSAKRIFNAIQQSPQETHMVLLALVWVCCGSNKSILAEYYKTFQQVYSLINQVSIFVGDRDPDWERWASLKFDLAHEREYKERVFAAKDFSQNPIVVEQLIWLVCLPGKYPPVAKTHGANFWFDEKLSPVEKIGTCMEAWIMNWILIFAYNRETRMFEIDKLKQYIGKSEGERLSDKLENFLRSNHPAFEGLTLTSLTVDTDVVANAWTDVISNISGCVYSLQYLQFKYSLNTLFKNVIISLNYLLNLNLYKDVNEESKRKDFIKTYLPKIWDKFHVNCEFEGQTLDLESIDEADGNCGIGIRLTFQKDGEAFPFTLMLGQAHAYFNPIYKILEKDKPEFIKSLKSLLERPYVNLPCLRGIKLKYLGFGDLENASRDIFLSEGQVRIWDFFWRQEWSLNDFSYIDKLIALFSDNDLSRDILIFLMRFVGNKSCLVRFVKDEDVWDRFNEFDKQDFETLKECVKRGRFIDEALAKAEECIISGKKEFPGQVGGKKLQRQKSLELFKELLKRPDLVERVKEVAGNLEPFSARIKEVRALFEALKALQQDK